MTTPDSIHLLRQVAVGDEEALRELYITYRPRLRYYLWRQLDSDASAVEEALQDTFLAVWRTAGGYRGEAKVATWLFQIAHNVALRGRASAARRRQSESDLELSEDATTPITSSPENEVLDQMTIDAAIQRLSTKHRVVLHLVFQQGFTAEEVAQILGVPIGTVKSRVSYARRALQNALACQLPEDARHDA